MANAPHWLMPTLWPQPEPEKVKVCLLYTSQTSAGVFALCDTLLCKAGPDDNLYRCLLYTSRCV